MANTFLTPSVIARESLIVLENNLIAANLVHRDYSDEFVQVGDTVTIRKVTGRDEVRQHLAELGFVVDGTVTVVSEIAGNLILQVKESRVALDRTLANRVLF